jgi:hypothetical protein
MWTVASYNQIALGIAVLIGVVAAWLAFRGRRSGE